MHFDKNKKKVFWMHHLSSSKKYVNSCHLLSFCLSHMLFDLHVKMIHLNCYFNA